MEHFNTHKREFMIFAFEASYVNRCCLFYGNMIFFIFYLRRVTEILGYKPIELLGKSCFEFYHQENQAEMFANFKQGNLFLYSLIKK